MPRVASLAAVAVILVAATASSARADCANPRVVFAPADGARVPPAPVLHVLVPGGDRAPRIVVLADGLPIEAQIEVASRGTGADVTALRVRPSAAARGRLTVAVEGLSSGSASYVIDPAWRASRRAAVELSGVSRKRDRWSCSHTDAFLLEVDSAAVAYQVEWASSADAWDTGAQSVQVLPRHSDDFWGVKPQRGATTIGLGYLSCLGETIPERALGGPLYVRVTGLLADGTTTARWAAPVLLTEPEAEPEPEPEPETVSDPDPDPDPDHAHEHEHEHEHPHVRAGWSQGLALAAALLLGAALIALLLRARRRRTTRVAPPAR